MKLLLSFSLWSVYGMLGDYKKKQKGQKVSRAVTFTSVSRQWAEVQCCSKDFIILTTCIPSYPIHRCKLERRSDLMSSVCVCERGPT